MFISYEDANLAELLKNKLGSAQPKQDVRIRIKLKVGSVSESNRKLDPYPNQIESWIRIRIRTSRIRYNGLKY